MTPKVFCLVLEYPTIFFACELSHETCSTRMKICRERPRSMDWEVRCFPRLRINLRGLTLATIYVLHFTLYNLEKEHPLLWSCPQCNVCRRAWPWTWWTNEHFLSHRDVNILGNAVLFYTLTWNSFFNWIDQIKIMFIKVGCLFIIYSSNI